MEKFGSVRRGNPELPSSDSGDVIDDGSTGVEYARRLAETRGIEEAVEAVGRERQVTGVLVEQIGPGVLAKAPKLARTISAGLFALGLQVGDVLAQTRPERTYSPEQQRTLESATGMPFSELKEKFDVDISVEPGPEGKYIIHIGQRHEHPKGGLSRAFNAPGTISAQQRLEPLIENVARLNKLQCIFLEGAAEDGEEYLSFLKRRINERMAEIERAMTDPNPTIASIGEAVRSLSKIENPISLGYLHNQLDTLFKKYSQMLPTLQAQNEEESLKLQLIEMSLATNALGRAISMDRPDPYHAGGATFKLYFDGKIPSICGAETESDHSRALNAFRASTDANEQFDKKKYELLDKLHASAEYKALRQKFDDAVRDARKGQDGKIIQEDLAPVRELFGQIQALESTTLSSGLTLEQGAVDRTSKEFDALAMAGREAAALHQIDQYDMKNIAAGYTLGNVAIVYGSAHDFSTAVRNWNQENTPHHPIQRGLIRIKLKE